MVTPPAHWAPDSVSLLDTTETQQAASLCMRCSLAICMNCDSPAQPSLYQPVSPSALNKAVSIQHLNVHLHFPLCGSATKASYSSRSFFLWALGLSSPVLPRAPKGQGSISFHTKSSVVTLLPRSQNSPTVLLYPSLTPAQDLFFPKEPLGLFSRKLKT